MLEPKFRTRESKRAIGKIARAQAALAGLLRLWSLAALALALVLPACMKTVVLISPYDEQTDVGATNLQKKVDGLFDQLGKTPMPDYPSTQATYADIHADFDALYSRNTLRDKNSLTVRQLTNLQSELKTLEDQHQGGKLIPVMLGPMRASLDQTFRAILKLEITKKETAPAD